jgi:hypothetical protein
MNRSLLDEGGAFKRCFLPLCVYGLVEDTALELVLLTAIEGKLVSATVRFVDSLFRLHASSFRRFLAYACSSCALKACIKDQGPGTQHRESLHMPTNGIKLVSTH